MFAFIIVLIVLAVIVGGVLLLDRLMPMRGTEKVRGAWQEKDSESSGDSRTSEVFKENLTAGIEDMIKSQKNGKEISEKILDIFDKELKRKAEEVAHQLKGEYKVIIEQKDKNEIIAQKKYKRVLRDKQNTESIIRSIAEGLVVVDSNGKVVMMNPTAEQLLGVSAKDKVGKPVTEGLKSEQLLSLLKEAAEGQDKEIELMSRKDETKKVLRSSTAVIEDEGGQTVGMVSVLSDVTKQRELEKIKSDFLAKVSHELRTPIMTLQNSVSILVKKTLGPLNEAQKKLLSIIERGLKRLALLIDEILDLSKLTSSKVKLEKELCSITDVIDEACVTLNAWAQSKGIKIEKMLQKDIPMVSVDANRIIQVLNNLIGNAIKFTSHKGKVVIEAGRGKNGTNIFVSVSDNGIGIAPEDIDKVFDKFQQVGERTSTDISGTGLGLAIAKEIVELHGGRIWAESEKDQGTKFTFTLPIPTARTQ